MIGWFNVDLVCESVVMMSNLFMGRVYYGNIRGMKYCGMWCVRNVIIEPTVLIDASLTHQDYFKINYPGDLSSSKLSCRVSC